MFFKILAVAGLGTFQIQAAIPTGLAFQLSPWLIFIPSVVGGIAGIYIIAFLRNKTRNYLLQKFTRNTETNNEKPKTGLIYRLWNRYGTFGLGFIGTLAIGAPLSMAAGIGCKAPLKKLITWC